MGGGEGETDRQRRKRRESKRERRESLKLDSEQSWALSVFLIFFNNRKLFFPFLIKLI